MHDLGRDPKSPDRKVDGFGSEPDAGPASGADEASSPQRHTELCPLCDIVNDTFLAPRQFVVGWRVAGDPAPE